MQLYHPHPVELAVSYGFVLSGPSQRDHVFSFTPDRLWILQVRGQRVAVMAPSEDMALMDAKEALPPAEEEPPIGESYGYDELGRFWISRPRTNFRLTNIGR